MLEQLEAFSDEGLGQVMGSTRSGSSGATGTTTLYLSAGISTTVSYTRTGTALCFGSLAVPDSICCEISITENESGKIIFFHKDQYHIIE